MTIADLQPGDCLLYKPTGFYGWLIRIKTWHPIAHVEVYRGNGQSVASRNGIGVGAYPVRLNDLCYVLRPTGTLDYLAGDRWFQTVVGAPYGWGDLLAFLGADVNTKGMVCSPFATDYYRACGCDPFNAEPSIRIAPFQFLLASCFTRVSLETQKVA